MVGWKRCAWQTSGTRECKDQSDDAYPAKAFSLLGQHFIEKPQKGDQEPCRREQQIGDDDDS